MAHLQSCQETKWEVKKGTEEEKMTAVLKHGFIGRREKMKYNGKNLRMKVYRLGGYAPIKKKIKIKNEQLIRLAFAESDRVDDKVLAAVKGENVCWCLYVTASRGFSGTSKTFRFVIVRKGLLMRKEDRKSMEEALEFAREVARGVGLYESRGSGDSYLFTREQGQAQVAEIVSLLDSEANDEAGDEDFADDEPDDD